MQLKQRIEKKEAKIGVVGLGYVGLPLILEFVDVGFHCIGFDIDDTKVNALNNKQTYILISIEFSSLSAGK